MNVSGDVQAALLAAEARAVWGAEGPAPGGAGAGAADTRALLPRRVHCLPLPGECAACEPAQALVAG